MIFAVLSYLFYMFAVVIIAGGLGYGLGVGIMTSFMDMGFLPWIVGIALAVVVVVVTLMFNLQKYVIIGATALAGALMAIGTLMLGAQGMADIRTVVDAPVKAMLNAGPLWAILFLAMAIGGIIVQYLSTKAYYPDEYKSPLATGE